MTTETLDAVQYDPLKDPNLSAFYAHNDVKSPPYELYVKSRAYLAELSDDDRFAAVTAPSMHWDVYKGGASRKPLKALTILSIVEANNVDFLRDVLKGFTPEQKFEIFNTGMIKQWSALMNIVTSSKPDPDKVEMLRLVFDGMTPEQKVVPMKNQSDFVKNAAFNPDAPEIFNLLLEGLSHEQRFDVFNKQRGALFNIDKKENPQITEVQNIVLEGMSRVEGLQLKAFYNSVSKETKDGAKLNLTFKSDGSRVLKRSYGKDGVNGYVTTKRDKDGAIFERKMMPEETNWVAQTSAEGKPNQLTHN